MAKSLSYADAGVDIDKANRLVDRIKTIVKSTPRQGVIGGIGGFGGLFSLNTEQYERPVLVSSTDGVGTKLRVAIMMDKHDTIGIDLVAMSVNDILVQGAKPLFFLDYLSMGKLNENTAADIIEGVAEGCRQANCALIGGETAEMPGMYEDGDYDLAGFAVGIADNFKIVDGSDVGQGNVLLGIASTGLHSNGYSLARKVFFDHLDLKVDSYVEDLGMTVGEAMLEPTKIYAEIVRNLIRDIHVNGMAHITGGGIIDNLPRTIPQSCKAIIREGSWEYPAIFPFMKKAGDIDEMEMMRTFNNGIGLVAVIPEPQVQEALELMQAMGEKAYVIGEIAARGENDDRIEWK
ncbi:phosphoribosylformylglycinamidine cyclo-ligase [Desulfatibacillum aliphaticivorans]|uniref:phosphoribosylformylglycinamidine cyclo-ligase n=1 Tax=Desulfatibacillum aliphaticivorans TaxID=218208 RepID=UPI00041B1D1E|nr:phosphoribosylformylglycinamidine cyclo-ligase [Desulfatibacillum aliphaticivorans]